MDGVRVFAAIHFSNNRNGLGFITINHRNPTSIQPSASEASQYVLQTPLFLSPYFSFLDVRLLVIRCGWTARCSRSTVWSPLKPRNEFHVHCPERRFNSGWPVIDTEHRFRGCNYRVTCTQAASESFGVSEQRAVHFLVRGGFQSYKPVYFGGGSATCVNSSVNAPSSGCGCHESIMKYRRVSCNLPAVK